MRTGLVPVASGLLDRFAALGVDPEHLLREAGLLSSRFQGPKATLTVAEFLTFFRAAEALGPPDLGLQLGSSAETHQLDVATLLALHSQNLGSALDKLERYKAIACAPHLWVESGKGVARIGVRWELTREALPPILVDGFLARVLSLANRGTRTSIVPRRLELARPAANAAMLEKHFQCSVRFGAPQDVLILDASLLSRPFVTHNADLVAVMLPGLESEFRERARSRSIADDVRILLSRRMTGERLSIAKLAAQLGTTVRSLQRRLAEVGTSYQSLLDEVRHHAARRFLGDAGLIPAEVGFLLGYKELNSFSRAFHDWEGITPEQWRHSHQGERGERSHALL